MPLNLSPYMDYTSITLSAQPFLRLSTISHRKDNVNSFQFWPLDTDEDIGRQISDVGSEMYLEGSDVQILSPFREAGHLSVHAINLRIQAQVNPAREENTSKSFPELPFRENDRVIVTRNNWEKRICNGDIGTFHYGTVRSTIPVFGVRCPDGRTIYWDQITSAFRVSLAYALTIHKSQGSEYDTVIIPLSRRFSNMLYRNLIYTAISRARKKVILVGDRDALDMALQREAPTRRSMLVSKVHMKQRGVA